MQSINRPELVREHNLEILRRALFLSRRATRQQLSEQTGISTVTLGALLTDLIQSGEAYEADTESSGTGRPFHVYCYNGDYRFGLSLRIQQEIPDIYLYVKILNRYGKVYFEEKRPFLHLDYQGTRSCLLELLKPYHPIGSVVIGLPGIGFQRYFREEADCQYLSLEALRELEHETGIPILLENDINLAALGYQQKQGFPTEKTMAYFFLMKGRHAGSAIYANGKIHQGKERFAGEIPNDLYGVDWTILNTEDDEKICTALLKLIPFYVSILAPHRIVIASNYITSAHLQYVRERLAAMLGQYCCPEFELTEDFTSDYENGVRQTLLEQIKVEVEW